MECPNCGSEDIGEIGNNKCECIKCGKVFDRGEIVIPLAEYKLDNLRGEIR